MASFARSPGLAAGCLLPALEALQHRGPDGQGTHEFAEGAVALGHTRLGVMAPGNGAQPLLDESGEIGAVVSGEFYGFEAIRRGLARRGHRFRVDCDSEILIHLYQEHGAACLDELEGEFAFVLWDGTRGRLLAARDRFGVRPLCYAEHRGRLLLASEAKALFALGLPRAWDDAVLYHACQLQYLPAGASLFRGVHELLPGELLIAERDGLHRKRYFDLDYPRAGEREQRSDAEWIDELSETLERAVARRLRCDAPLCIQLSGGVDSSAVAALAAAAQSRPLTCFSVSFPDSAYDELASAAATAHQLDAELVPVSAGASELASVFPAAVAQGEGLCINLHIAAKYLMSRAMREHGFKVVLTGEGADELFAGYAHLAHDSLPGLDGEALKSDNRASLGSMLAHGEALPTGAWQAALGYVPAFVRAKATLGRRVQRLLEPEFMARFANHDAARVVLSSAGFEQQLAGREPLDQSLYLWNRSALSGYILRTLGDGMEMAHSLEGRLPFLDTDLFRLARRLPSALRLRAGVAKYALREALLGRIPEAVRTRRKHPFLAPPFCLESQQLLRELWHDPSFRGLHFASQPAVLEVLERLPALSEDERIAWDPALMLLTSAAILQRSYGL